MAGEPHFDELSLVEGEPGRWHAEAGGMRWPIAPAWATPDEADQVAWLIEQPPGSAVAAYRAAVERTARAAGERLWSSVLDGAPEEIAERLKANRLALAVEPVADRRLLEWAMMRSPDGWLAPALRGFRVRVGAAPPEAPAALRVLLVVARPFGDADVPSHSLAWPVAETAAAHGGVIERVYPARRRALADAIASARGRGEPYTALVFDGHGVAGACLALESELGGEARIDVAALLEDLGDSVPPLVVLAACRTARPAAGQDSTTTFGGELARRSGAEVIGMAGNVAPAATARFTAGLLDRLWRGDELASAVQGARRDLFRLDPDSYDWAAPIHFQTRPLEFARSADPPRPGPPPGVVRADLETVDAVFEARPVHLVFAPPYAGKSHFLAAYGWWRNGAASGRPAPMTVDARRYPEPDALLADPVLAGARPDALTLIDNAEHWARLPAASWEGFARHCADRFAGGGRWLIASRHWLDDAEALRGVASDAPLAALGQLGIQGVADIEPVETYFFGEAWRADPWLTLVYLAMRGEPPLLAWARDRLAEGLDGRRIFWRFLMPDDLAATQISALLDPPPPLDTDPLLGWTFGILSLEVLGWLSTPPESWEDRQAQAQARETWAAVVAALSDRDLAVAYPGGGALMSAAHATLLRARMPVDGWPPELRRRMAEAMTIARGMADIGEYHEDEMPADLRDRLIDTVETLSERLPTITEKRAFLMALTNLFPAAATAAAVAARDGRAYLAAEVATGASRGLTQLGLGEAVRAWLSHWRPEIERLVRNGKDEDGERALNSLAEEEQYLSLLGLRGIGATPLRPLPPSLMEKLAEEGELDDSLLDEFLAAGGTAAITERLGPALEALLRRSAPAGRSPERIARLAMVAAHLEARRGRFEEARRQIASAEAQRDRLPPMLRFVLACTKAEVLINAREDMTAVLGEALSQARKLGDAGAVGYVRKLMGDACAVAGDLEGAVRHHGEALRLLDSNSIARCEIFLSLSRAVASQGELALAEAYRAEAERLSAQIGLELIHLEAMCWRPWLAWMDDRLDAAREAAEELLAVSIERGFDHGQGIAFLVAALAHLSDDDHEAAVDSARLAASRLRPLPMEGFVGRARWVEAHASFCLDRFDDACIAQQEAVAAAGQHFIDAGMIADQWAWLELYALAAEDFDLALRAAERVDTLAGGHDRYSVALLGAMAEGWLVAARPDLSRARCRLALALLEDGDAEQEAALLALLEASEDADSAGR